MMDMYVFGGSDGVLGGLSNDMRVYRLYITAVVFQHGHRTKLLLCGYGTKGRERGSFIHSCIVIIISLFLVL